RAGNVIGGGDWASERLLPDAFKAWSTGAILRLRNPGSVRPWQHVLECLAGYLMLGQRLLNSDAAFADAWNFGPDASDNRTVSEVLEAMRTHWPEFSWHLSAESHPHEANLLYLDVAKARSRLHWSQVWTLEEALEKTVTWYQAHMSGAKPPSRDQLLDYVVAARKRHVPWGAA
ncbi:MAG: CDP-glucose 4,6-dehydratase, partial [Proteobacteria bacterium]|nr:CDP-glucose 4,6-dehydratase [Pseudomonadota bacterium]